LRLKDKKETDKKVTEAKNLLAELQATQTAKLKVSIPLFSTPKIKARIIQSISIADKPPIIGTSEMKTEALSQSNPTSSTNLKLSTKRRYSEKAIKNTFFQAKKSKQSANQTHTFCYENPNHWNATPHK
jgi:hypothetical protein